MEIVLDAPNIHTRVVPDPLTETWAAGQQDFYRAVEAGLQKWIDAGIDAKDLIVEYYPPEIDTGGCPARQFVVRQRFLVRDKRSGE